MSINPNTLPDSFKRCLPTEVKKGIGKAAMTMEEIKDANNARRESEVQQRCGLLLDHMNIIYNRSDMRRKTTCRPGWPDFTFAINGRACAIEIKVGHNMLTVDQQRVIDSMIKNGWLVAVAHNEEHFLYFVRKWSNQNT